MNSRREFISSAAAAVVGVAVSQNVADAATPVVMLLNGRGKPRRGQGIVGDFYIDDSAHVIYGPKRSSGWGEPTSLIGPQGCGVLHGTGAPAASLGQNDDFYIDTATTQLYGPKSGGVWGSPVSLTGSANISAIDGGAP